MTSQRQLVLINDDEHDFNYVRASLIRHCKHEFLQAEQCVIIAHNNKECVVKEGDVMDLISMQEKLTTLGLKTKLISLN